MTSFLLITALVGATLIVTRSTLFGQTRRLWPALLGCSQCVGLWVGVAVGASGLVAPTRYCLVNALIVGASASFSALLADGVLLRLLGDPDE